MGIAAGAMIYKKTHTACGQCGSKDIWQTV